MNGRLLVHIPISLDTKSAFCDPLGRPFELFFTPQVIGAVIGAAWHMAREKVSTNWAANSGRVAVPPRTRERRDVQRESGPPKKMHSEWQIDHCYQSICLLSNQLTYQKKGTFSSCDLKLVTPVFPPGNL